MLKKRLRRAGLAILLFILACTSSPGEAASMASFTEVISSARSPAEPSRSSRADKLTDQEETFCLKPSLRGILLALTRWGSTSLAVFDFPKKRLVPLLTRPTGEMLLARARHRIAYLVREGVNPARNHVEILDLRQGRCQLLTPAKDFAILGFALAPGGRELAYAGMNLRLSNSSRLSWRAGIADLDGYQTNTLAVSAKDGLPREAIPVPFQWSGRTGEIYVRNLMPFRGMAYQGIMAMRPDGSRARMILAEPSYTGRPRLSPNGAALAYLTTRVEALPQNYIPSPGAPPGNALIVMDLVTGERSAWIQESGAALGAFAWSADGTEIAVSRQEWVEGRLRDVALLKVGKATALELLKIALAPSARVTDIGMCKDRSFFWVEEDPKQATLRGAGPNGDPVDYVVHADGRIQLAGCVGE